MRMKPSYLGSFSISPQGLTYPPRPSSLELIYATTSSSTVATHRSTSPFSDSDGVIVLDSPSPSESPTVMPPVLMMGQAEESIRGRSRSPTPRYNATTPSDAVCYSPPPLVGLNNRDESKGSDHIHISKDCVSPLPAQSPETVPSPILELCDKVSFIPVPLIFSEDTAQSHVPVRYPSPQLSQSTLLHSPVINAPQPHAGPSPSPKLSSQLSRSDLPEESPLSPVTASRPQSPPLSPADVNDKPFPWGWMRGGTPSRSDTRTPDSPPQGLFLQNAASPLYCRSPSPLRFGSRSRSRSHSPRSPLPLPRRCYYGSQSSLQSSSHSNCEYISPLGCYFPREPLIRTPPSIHCQSETAGGEEPCMNRTMLPTSSMSTGTRDRPEHPPKTLEGDHPYLGYTRFFGTPYISPVIPSINVDNVSPSPAIPSLSGLYVPPLEQFSVPPPITIPPPPEFASPPSHNNAIPPPIGIPPPFRFGIPPPPWASLNGSHQQTPKIRPYTPFFPPQPISQPWPPVPPLAPLAPSTKKNERFYFEDGDVTFQIKQILFKVHSHFFKQHSPVIGAKLQHRAGQHTESFPVLLSDAEPYEFELLLSIFYPVNLMCPDVQTLDEWSAILRLADLYEMQKVRSLAITHLERIAPAADKIKLANTYHIKDWLVPAYMELCTRTEALTLEEGKKVGVEAVMMIGELKQQLLDGVKRFVDKSAV